MAARPHETGPERRARRSEKRTELMLGALAALVLVAIAAMVVTVLIEAWPSFSYNGLGWFGTGAEPSQQLRAMHEGTPLPGHGLLYFTAWQLIWGTILTTVFAVLFALIVSTLAAVFIVEFAPPAVHRALDPVIRLLAGIPSVIYGLIGIVAIAPWVSQNLISTKLQNSVAYVVQLNGQCLITAIFLLTIMIIPIMVSITVNALESVPRSWTEGSAALGVNRWRTMWRVSLRTAMPAIAASAVLATARALGEAVMLAMVAGGRDFAPNALDGLAFFFEPVRPLAATIFQESESLTIGPVSHTLYAIAALLLVSAVLLSFVGWAARQPLKKYGLS